MIKVMTGYSGPGGSTVAFNNLVNLFNKSGLEARLYGPQLWEGINCKFMQGFVEPKLEDTVIYHFMMTPNKPCKKLILSCHETNLYPIAKIPDLRYDNIHFVSKFQEDWHGVSGTVIPNIITPLTCDVLVNGEVVGIIGSVDRNKRIPLSIKRALDDDFTDIRIYGGISDPKHFLQDIVPLLGEKVRYCGVSHDMQKVYDTLTHVYHSPLLETYNMIKAECAAAGVVYRGEEGNDTKAEVWGSERIMMAWAELLND